MRLAAVLLLALVAGCADRSAPTPTTATTPTTTPPTEEPPVTTTPTATTPTTNATPTPRPPVVLYDREHDFAASPAPTPKTDSFNVTSGALLLRMNVTFSGSTIGVSGNVRVTIQDSGERTHLSCSRDACGTELPSPPSGEWRVLYEGAGTTRASVRVVQT